MNQAVPRTTPSRRRVTRHGLVHNGWGVGRHCGRLAGECSFPREEMQERKTTQQARKGKSHPPKNKKHPRNTGKPTRTPNREAATRPKNRKSTEHKRPGFRGKKKREITENSGRTGLDAELEAEVWIEPRERVDQPLGLTKIPGPPGTAGISVSPAPEKVNKE